MPQFPTWSKAVAVPVLGALGILLPETGWVDQDGARVIAVLCLLVILVIVLPPIVRWLLPSVRVESPPAAEAWRRWRARRSGLSAKTAQRNLPPPAETPPIPMPETVPAPVVSNLGYGSSALAEPSRWYPDPSELVSLKLADSDLDRALAAAEEHLRRELAPDAIVEFERLAVHLGAKAVYGTAFTLQIDFRGWSDLAGRGQSVSVDHGLTPWGQYAITERWPQSGPAAPWREDPSWLEVIRMSWYRIRPFRGFAVLTFRPTAMGPYWSICYIDDIPFNEPTTGKCFRLVAGDLQPDPVVRVERFHWA